MADFITTIANMLSETTLEDEFVSMRAVIRAGKLVVETETVVPEAPFVRRTSIKDDIVRRRFSQTQDNEVEVEVFDGGTWIPEDEATWVNVA